MPVRDNGGITQILTQTAKVDRAQTEPFCYYFQGIRAGEGSTIFG
jgi:hypothetical protein